MGLHRFDFYLEIDLVGKGRRVRTVAVPLWVKHGINAWMTAGAIEEGRPLRSIRKAGKVGIGLSDWAVWDVVQQSANRSASSASAPVTFDVPALSSAARMARISNRFSSCSHTVPSRPQNDTSGPNRRSP